MTVRKAPGPRVAGVTDLLIGPGATPGEGLVTFGAAALGIAGAVLAGVLHAAPWTPWQFALVAVVAFDLFGGAVANATTAARRWWHRPDRSVPRQLGFVLAHVHPFALAALLPGYGWAAAAATYAATALGAAAVVLVPPGLRRPTAYAAGVLGIGAVAVQAGVAPELAWFGPVLIVKLLIAHLPIDGADGSPPMVGRVSPPKGLHRLLFRAPVHLFRLGLGGLLGSRFVLLTHTGRSSGRPRRTVLEVVECDRATGTVVIASGYGERAQWMRNILADPAVCYQVGRRSVAGTAVPLPAAESGRRLARYARDRPRTAAALMRMIGHTARHPADFEALGADRRTGVPLVELRPRT